MSARPAASPAPAAPRSESCLRRWGPALLIAAACLIAYLPTLRNGFVWDDDTFLTRNPLIRAPDGLFRFWFTTQPTDYWPVTSTSLWLEWRLWGESALGYHAVNLVLHAFECVLLWAILRRLRHPAAMLAVLLFALHPVNVESVAWIAQSKNMVAMLFYLGSVYFFVRGADRDEVIIDRWYWLSLGSFALAMLSKGSVAPLPLVLLGIVAWRRGLRWADVLRLIPFFGVAAALAAVNVWFQTHGTGEVIRHAGPLERLLGAAAAVWFYLGKAVWPVGLSFVYPQWRIDSGSLLWWLPLIAAVAVTGALWKVGRLAPKAPPGALGTARPTLGRQALCAWGYFCLMLVPVMGFTDVYFMRYSLVADHYQHLALIGLAAFAAAAWVRWPLAPVGKRVLAAAVLAAFAALTWRQCLTYRDAETLYRSTLARDPAAWMVYNNLGELRLDAGRVAEARADFEAALGLEPSFAEAHVNLGLTELDQGRPAVAVTEYQRAIRERPRYAKAYYNLGIALQDLGRSNEAVQAFEAALRLQPDYPEAENNLGAVLADSGRLPEAIERYLRALQLDPTYAEAHNNLANALQREGRTAEALEEYARALKARPDYPEAECNLGLALQAARRPDQAIPHFLRAIRLRPDYLSAHDALGIALAEVGRLDDAEAEFDAALRIDPNYGPARRNLERLRSLRR